MQNNDSHRLRGIPRRRFNTGLVLAGAAIAAGPVIAACGGDDDDDATPTTSTTTGTTTGTGTATTTAATGTASASTTPSIEEFIVANEAEPADLLPYFGSYPQALVTRTIYENLVEPRMELQPDGSVIATYVPGLAERYERVEPARWRFFLREGVTFHNGEEWNAEAARVSFDLLSDTDLAGSLNKTTLLRGAQLEVVDPMTIDVIFPTPDTEVIGGGPLRLGFVALPPKLLEEKGFAALAENPVGTGPFEFVSWTRGQDVRVKKYANYWNPEATNIPALRFIPRPDPGVRALTVRAGEAHMAYNIGGEQAKSLEHRVIGGGFQSSSLRLNNTIAPTSDIRVRRAINLAIDRQAIADALFAGTARPIGFFAFQPVDVEPFAYDPEEAARLISEAAAEGQELELVYGENRIPEEPQMVEYYKAQLEAAGLKVKLTRLEPRQYNEVGGLPFDQQPPLFMETTSSGNFADNASGIRDKYGCKGSGTFCDPELDAAVEEMAQMEGTEKLAALQAIATQLQEEDVPRCWVVGVQQVHGLAEGVETNLPLNAYILFNNIRIA